MYALIENGLITQVKPSYPALEFADGRWWDNRDDNVRSSRGWHPVVRSDRPAETDTELPFATYVVIDGKPHEVWQMIEKDEAYIRSEFEREAILIDIENRLERIENKLWPPSEEISDPESTDIPEWNDFNGVWPNGQVLRDNGTIWKNVSGVPLTSKPSDFPGDPSSWTHLFIAVLGTETPPSEGAEPWSAQASYQVGDIVEHNGKLWECLIAHGAEYQGTWAPGVAHTVWQELGPA